MHLPLIEPSKSDLLLALSLFFLGLLVLRNSSRKKALPYPPGPPPKFLIGNALDIPHHEAPPIFAEWGKRYHSDIVHASALGKHIVVLNTREIAEELLEKRAAIYNDRPQFAVLDLIGWTNNTAFMNGPLWRQHRKILRQYLGQEASKKYARIYHESVDAFLRGVLEEPEKLYEHSKMLSISITLLVMYGYRPSGLNDPVIHAADRSAALAASLLSIGGSMINIFPILKHVPAWVPGASSHKVAKQCKLLTEATRTIPVDRVKKEFMEGTARPSFFSSFLEKKMLFDASDEEEEIMKDVATTVYGAASDTTISAAEAFYYLMTVHPDVQRRAKADIDSIVGNDRLPDLEDRKSLPYIEAIYREVLRQSCTAPMAVPHSTSADDVYEGYLIPKGSVVIANVWAMTHDERVYPDPFAFKPERFLDADGKLNDDNRVLLYGFGGRICPGKYVASAQMWLTMASFLACFDIGKALDDLGNPTEVHDDYVDNGLLRHKKPFKYSITPRSDRTRKLIEATAEGQRNLPEQRSFKEFNHSV